MNVFPVLSKQTLAANDLVITSRLPLPWQAKQGGWPIAFTLGNLGPWLLQRNAPKSWLCRLWQSVWGVLANSIDHVPKAISRKATGGTSCQAQIQRHHRLRFKTIVIFLRRSSCCTVYLYVYYAVKFCQASHFFAMFPLPYHITCAI